MAILENPWKDNTPMISCIPAGRYTCLKRKPNREDLRKLCAKANDGDEHTFEIMDVPNRSGILFHPGNSENDTHGCPLPGTGIYELTVTDSRNAFKALMKRFENENEFELDIHIYKPIPW